MAILEPAVDLHFLTADVAIARSRPALKEEGKKGEEARGEGKRRRESRKRWGEGSERT